MFTTATFPLIRALSLIEMYVGGTDCFWADCLRSSTCSLYTNMNVTVYEVKIGLDSILQLFLREK